MIPQLKSIFNQNQLTSLINLLTQNVNALIAGKLNLTGGTMSGAIAMATNKITGLGNPTANQDAATKIFVENLAQTVQTSAAEYTDIETGAVALAANAYTDTQVATKQNLFDYSGSATGTNSVTINDKKGGVARFTRVIPPVDYRILTLNSNFILSTSKIIPVLVYSGAGFPVILSQSVDAGKVDFIVANLDVDGSGGASTDSTMSIEYQIVG